MNRIPAIILKAVVVTAAFLAPSNLYGQADMEIEETEDYYQIQFNEGEGTPLRDLIILCQRITAFPIQFQEAEVQDQLIYIIGKQKVRKSSQGFFEYFQSVLVSYEFICAPYGPEEEPFFITVKKMTPSAAQRGGDIFKAQAPVVPLEELKKYKNSPGQLITTTLQMKYIEARTTLQSLNPYFMNAQLESLRSVDNSNSLIITGFANKVYYVAELIKLMDVPPQEIEVEFIKRELKYAVAEELEPILTQLVAAAQNLRPGQQAQPRAGTQSGLLVEPEPKIIAEPRTNSLLVTGSKKTTTKILSWIEQLDVETDPRGDIHVYRLKNTLAVDMQRVLDDMLQGQQQGAATRRQPGTGGGAIPSTGIEAPAQVVADEISNSLIITASKTKYAELLAVVQELDIRRKQVLIESAIVEMKSRVDDTLAIEMAGIDLKSSPDNYYRPFGFTSFGLSDLTWDAEDPSNSQRVPNVSTGFTGGIFDGDGLSLPFILYTLARENKANILSMPSILTNDNEQAVIQALDEEPTFSLNQGQNTDSTTFDGYEKAGITLTISPSISAGNYLKLQIKIEVSNFDESADSSPPPKSTREVTTAVTIPDGHTMVVGGVIINDQTEVEQKVPLLGDLPLIGWLFRSRAQTEVKVNLYIFITPHIIGDDFANLDDISYQKKKEVEALRGDVLLIDPDFEMTNADERMIGAGASWIFEIPSYAEPETGETSNEYIKPKENTSNSEK